jgi:hypothetical protein
MERDIFREEQNEGEIDREEDNNSRRESSRRRRKEKRERKGREECGRRGRGMSVPDARVEVVWLKSRHAMGPSWPDSTSNNRP